MTPTIHDELCDKNKVCEILGIGTTKFYQLLGTGEIQACKIGKATKVRRSEIARYIASLQPYKPENEEA